MKQLVGLSLVAMSAMTACARGDREVPFQPHFVFQVDGLAAFPDHVFFAYPCHQPQEPGVAAPNTPHVHVVLREGQQVAVREGGGPCTVYAVAAPDYANFSHAYTPSKDVTDPAMDALRQRSQQCGAPAVTFDKKQRVEQSLTIAAVTAIQCAMKSTRGPEKAGVR